MLQWVKSIYVLQLDTDYSVETPGVRGFKLRYYVIKDAYAGGGFRWFPGHSLGGRFAAC